MKPIDDGYLPEAIVPLSNSNGCCWSMFVGFLTPNGKGPWAARQTSSKRMIFVNIGKHQDDVHIFRIGRWLRSKFNFPPQAPKLRMNHVRSRARAGNFQPFQVIELHSSFCGRTTSRENYHYCCCCWCCVQWPESQSGLTTYFAHRHSRSLPPAATILPSGVSRDP